MMLTPRQRSVLVSVAALLLMLALSALSSAGAVTQVYRLLQAELDGHQIGSAAYAAQSVSGAVLVAVFDSYWYFSVHALSHSRCAS